MNRDVGPFGANGSYAAADMDRMLGKNARRRATKSMHGALLKKYSFFRGERSQGSRRLNIEEGKTQVVSGVKMS